MLNRLARGVSLAALILVSGAASAAEPEAVANRLKDIFSNQGITLGWASVEGSGDTAVLKGATLVPAGSTGPTALGDVTISGIEDQSNGDITLGSIAVPDYSFISEGTNFTIQGMAVNGFTLPGPNTTGIMQQVGIFDEMVIAKIIANNAGKDVFVMDGLTYNLEMEDGSSDASFTASADSFKADLSTVPDPQGLAMLTALGLVSPTGSFEAAGDMSLSEGTVNLEQMDFTIDDAGTLGLTMAFGGYTEEVMKAFQEMSKTMANATEEQKQAQGMAALGLMQQLSFVSASIRYDEDKLATRAIDLAAGMQNMKRSDMVGMARMMIPAMAGEYVSPEFAQKVAEAVAKFLEEPKSLEVKASPAQPVPFAMVAAGAMASPKALPEQLGVTVTANE